MSNGFAYSALGSEGLRLARTSTQAKRIGQVGTILSAHNAVHQFTAYFILKELCDCDLVLKQSTMLSTAENAQRLPTIYSVLTLNTPVNPSALTRPATRDLEDSNSSLYDRSPLSFARAWESRKLQTHLESTNSTTSSELSQGSWRHKGLHTSTYGWDERSQSTPQSSCGSAVEPPIPCSTLVTVAMFPYSHEMNLWRPPPIPGSEIGVRDSRDLRTEQRTLAASDIITCETASPPMGYTQSSCASELSTSEGPDANTDVSLAASPTHDAKEHTGPKAWTWNVEAQRYHHRERATDDPWYWYPQEFA